MSCEEMSAAMRVLCRNVQRESFPKEYECLSNNKEINVTSAIISLTPFLDREGIMRVGGRLKHSDMLQEARHPMLLPRKHRLTELIILQEHIRNLHSGLQATMSAVRSRFWPLSLRTTARRIIRNCVACFKCRPVVSETIMGNLPRDPHRRGLCRSNIRKRHQTAQCENC